MGLVRLKPGLSGVLRNKKVGHNKSGIEVPPVALSANTIT